MWNLEWMGPDTVSYASGMHQRRRRRRRGRRHRKEAFLRRKRILPPPTNPEEGLSARIAASQQLLHWFHFNSCRLVESSDGAGVTQDEAGVPGPDLNPNDYDTEQDCCSDSDTSDLESDDSELNIEPDIAQRTDLDIWLKRVQ